MAKRVEPADVVIAAVVVQVFVADWFLARGGHKLVSTRVRENPHARRAVRWGAAHLTDTIPGDFLSLLGKRIAR